MSKSEKADLHALVANIQMARSENTTRVMLKPFHKLDDPVALIGALEEAAPAFSSEMNEAEVRDVLSHQGLLPFAFRDKQTLALAIAAAAEEGVTMGDRFGDMAKTVEFLRKVMTQYDPPRLYSLSPVVGLTVRTALMLALASGACTVEDGREHAMRTKLSDFYASYPAMTELKHTLIEEPGISPFDAAAILKEGGAKYHIRTLLNATVKPKQQPQAQNKYKGKGGGGGGSGGGPKEQANFGREKKPGTCNNCKQPGHIKRYCPTVECFKCHGKGHIAPDCRDGPQQCELPLPAARPSTTHAPHTDAQKRPSLVDAFVSAPVEGGSVVQGERGEVVGAAGTLAGTGTRPWRWDHDLAARAGAQPGTPPRVLVTSDAPSGGAPAAAQGGWQETTATGQ